MKMGWGMHAAAAALALTAAVGVASAAETGDDATISVGQDDNSWSETEVRIDPGDTVTWAFTGGPVPHNVKADNDVAADPQWKDFLEPGNLQAATQPVSRPFPHAGTYVFVCQFHPGSMRGTIVVGDGGATATPTGTATSTPAVTASATPEPTPHVQDSPRPGGAADTVRPTVGALQSRALRRGAYVHFRLSEPATITLKVRRRGRVVKTVRVQVRAGSRSVRLRGLRKGRYTVELRARDAMGNLSAVRRVTVRAR